MAKKTNLKKRKYVRKALPSPEKVVKARRVAKHRPITDVVSNIPPPKKVVKRVFAKGDKYPFKQMKVNDSFAMRLATGDTLLVVERRLINTVNNWKRRKALPKEWEFVTKGSLVKREVRIWRIK